MGVTRAFVALPLPDRVRDGLATIAGEIPSGHPVDAEAMHLTLAFLGDQDEAALEELHDELSATHRPGFALRITGLGVFGGAQPRALWAGIAPEPGLNDLQKAVTRAARTAGIVLKHRRFVPHVTLVRFRKTWVEDAAFSRFVAGHAGFALPAFEVRAFALYASHLRADGALYEELARYPLGFDRGLGPG